MPFVATWMKLEIELPYNPAIPLVEQNCNSKRYIHFYVHNSTIHNNQDMEIT